MTGPRKLPRLPRPPLPRLQLPKPPRLPPRGRSPVRKCGPKNHVENHVENRVGLVGIRCRTMPGVTRRRISILAAGHFPLRSRPKKTISRFLLFCAGKQPDRAKPAA